MAATAAQTRRDRGQFLSGLDLGLGSRLPPIALEEGGPAEALQLSPDLVVIGTRGYGVVGRLVLDSVAEEALRTLDCDVLAVPPEAT